MYIAQTTKDRIKKLCKENKVSMENMLFNCSLGVNAIRQINDTKGMASFSLAKIADYLDCSVDYLLGRTDNPNSHKQ
ncbi:MAG: helix-turn-helix transcriptional regulator [Clostridiales bacterium]|nr:helix-turn-helix transcriptional regulator [Clostridiales bacterium]